MNLIFPHIFSRFAIPHPSEWESFEESTGHSLSFPAEQTHICPQWADCPHHGQDSQLDVGQSSQLDARLRSHELQHVSFPDGSGL